MGEIGFVGFLSRHLSTLHIITNYKDPNLQINGDILGAEAADEPVLAEADRNPNVGENVLRVLKSFSQNFANQIQKETLILKIMFRMF